MPEGLLHVLQLGDAIAINLALALVLGGWVSGHWLPPNPSGWGQDGARTACRLRRVGFAVGVVALLALWWLQAVSMSEAAALALPTAAWRLLVDTHFGQAWWVGAVAWLLAAAGAWPLQIIGTPFPQAGRRVLTAMALAAFVWSRSVVSHAGAQGDWSVDVAVDGLHLLLVSVWVGIVLVAAATKLPAAPAGQSDGTAAAHWVACLSATATLALAGIVLTGAFKTWVSVPELAALGSTDYGQRLWIKLGLVSVAVALGGYNRFKVMPPLRLEMASPASPAARPWLRHWTLALRLEAAVLLAVLVVAAALSSTEPPGVA